MSSKRYDLQGIRGIAILLVLLFHLKPNLFPLGFIGLDMFFVLSGYLMTSILSKKNITPDVIVDFYKRRFKRIVPLFVSILFLVYLVSWFFLISADRLQLLTDLKWSLTFTSNMQPLFEVKDYWDQVTSYRFLVHCWSLGVEIQFYVIAPFVVGYCREKKWNFAVFILLVGSLLFQILSPPKISYGLLPSRIWQFLCGTLAYELEQRHALKSNNYISLPNDDASLSSSENDHYPKIATCLREMLVVSLTLLVITNPSTLNETKMRILGTFLTTFYICTAHFSDYSFLSSKPLVYIGDISYTLYLVHWPTIIFYKYYYSITELRILDASWCLILMFLLSIVVHHTLENFLLRSTIMSGTCLAATCILCILLTSPLYENDVQRRFNEPEEENATTIIQRAIEWNTHIQQTRQGVEVDLDNPNRTYTWLPGKRDFEADKLSGWTEEAKMRCIARGNGTLNVLVMGNSISYRAFPRIHKIFNGRYNTLRLFSKSMLPGVYASPKSPNSLRYETALKNLVEKSKPDVIFIMYASLLKEGPELQSHVVNFKNDTAFLHLQENFDFYSKYTRKIVVDLPYYTREGFVFIGEIIKRLKLGKPLNDMKIARKDLDKQQHWQHERLRHLNCPKCILNDVNEALFTGDTFYFYDRKTYYSYYHDGTHLTYAGLDLLMPLYTNVIEKVIKELT